MLPERLSSDLCSLRPGADRAAVTVEMVVGGDGTVGETRFSRSLIRSERRLTYPEVDGLLAGGGLGDPALESTSAAPRRSPPPSASGGCGAGRSRPSRPSRSCASTATGSPRSAGGPDAGPLPRRGVHDRRQRGRRPLPHRTRGADGLPPSRGARAEPHRACSTHSSTSWACRRLRSRAASSGRPSAGAPPRGRRGRWPATSRPGGRRPGALAARSRSLRQAHTRRPSPATRGSQPGLPPLHLADPPLPRPARARSLLDALGIGDPARPAEPTRPPTTRRRPSARRPTWSAAPTTSAPPTC